MSRVAGLKIVGTSETVSAASMVYGQIRRDILGAYLSPHAKLRIDDLCERYGVGASPVREALNRLSAEGLVVQQDQKGFRAAPIGEDDLSQLTRARCLLNEVLLRESVALGDAAWEEAILLAYHRLSRVSSTIDEDPRSSNPLWVDQHRAFHHTLLAGSNAELLLRYSDVLFDLSERYRVLARLDTAPRRAPDEHEAIMHAAMDRQADVAVSLMNTHLQRTAEAVRRLVFHS